MTTFESIIFSSELSVRGLFSWLLLISIGIKFISTVIGLVKTRDQCLHPGIWWVSKVSALTVAACMLTLAYFAGQMVLQLIFGVLLVLAAITVLVMSVRRAR